MRDETTDRTEASRTDSGTDVSRRRVLRNAAAGAVVAAGLGASTASADDSIECRVGHGVINGTCYEIECCTNYGTCGTRGLSSHCSDDATNHSCCEEFCYDRSC